MTVTATQGGSTAVGVGLDVRVVRGAAPVQNGMTAALTITTPDTAITPNASGSWIYGSVIVGGTTAFTAAASTTLRLNFSANSAVQLGTCKMTTPTTTTAATPVTVGASAPANGGEIALLEILVASGQVLVEDASTPAAASAAAALTVTTAAFTPPSGALLVAMIASDGGVGTATMTLTDTMGLGWTPASVIAATGDGYNGIWIARIPLSAGSAAAPYRSYPPAWKPGLPAVPGCTPFTRLAGGWTAPQGEGWGQPL